MASQLTVGLRMEAASSPVAGAAPTATSRHSSVARPSAGPLRRNVRLQAQAAAALSTSLLQTPASFRRASPLRCTLSKRPTAAVASVEEDLTPDNVTVLVVGGGGVGMSVLRQLAKAGGWVTAIQRGEKFRKEIEGLGAMLAIGDVLQPATLDKALRSNTFDATICTVGGGHQDLQVDSQGIINVIDSCKKAGVSRFVLVTSIGVGDSKDAVPEKQMEVLGPVLVAKGKAEEYLKASGLEWTIIRPGGLMSSDATGKAFLTENTKVCGAITRQDVADLALRCLFDRKSVGKVLSAVDKEKIFASVGNIDIQEFAIA